MKIKTRAKKEERELFWIIIALLAAVVVGIGIGLTLKMPEPPPEEVTARKLETAANIMEAAAIVFREQADTTRHGKRPSPPRITSITSNADFQSHVVQASPALASDEGADGQEPADR